MRTRDRISLAVRGYLAEMRHEFAESRQVMADEKAEWRQLIAAYREHKQVVRRMWEEITGTPTPSRRQRRAAQKAVLAEADELDELTRRAIAEHQQQKED